MPKVKLSELEPIDVEPRRYTEAQVHAERREAFCNGLLASSLALFCVAGIGAFVQDLRANTRNDQAIVTLTPENEGLVCSPAFAGRLSNVTINGQTQPDETITSEFCIRESQVQARQTPTGWQLVIPG